MSDSDFPRAYLTEWKPCVADPLRWQTCLPWPASSKPGAQLKRWAHTTVCLLARAPADGGRMVWCILRPCRLARCSM